MAGKFDSTSTNIFLLLWTLYIVAGKGEDLSVRDSNPLPQIFSMKDLIEYHKKCNMHKEEEKNEALDSWAVNYAEKEKGCLKIEGLLNVLTVTNITLASENVGIHEAAFHRGNKDDMLMMTRKAALFVYRRDKRSPAFEWTCAKIQSIPMLFLTATDQEIEAMDNNEFISCIASIGKILDLKPQQRDAVLSKAKTVLSKTEVCDMDTSDIVNLGVIALAYSETDLACLPLNDMGLVTALGALEEWTNTELSALASAYISSNSLTDLSTLTSSQITKLGSILCGFTSSQIATIPSAEIGKIVAQIGGLHECSVEQFAELVKLATAADAYGPVGDLDAAKVTELGYLIAGLPGKKIKELPVAAVEGLKAEIIPVIPADVFKDMTKDQIESFTDAQAVSVTNNQTEAMPEEQKALLGDQATDGEKEIEEVSLDNPPSTGSFIEMSLAGLGLLLILILLT